MLLLESCGRQGAFKWVLTGILVLVCAWLGADVSAAYAQGSIPDIRGTYQGPVVITATCPDGSGATATHDATVSIPTQQGQSFSGSTFCSTIDQGCGGGVIVFSGTVDANGHLTGNYSYNDSSISGSGTFTGQASADQIQLSLAGTINVITQICNQTFMITAMRTTSTGPTADLSITGSASAGQVASGARITYTLTIMNAGPADATGVLVTNPTPSETTFASATASQGQVQGPGPGTQGNVIYLLGTLGKGTTATVTITANVLAPAGSTLVDSPFVASALPDPNVANNSATISTPVVGGAIIKLVWDQPPPTASNPTPAPRNLRVEVASQAAADLSAQAITPQDSCTLITINIYKSDASPVQPIPANLWVAVPPSNLQSTLAAAPGGSFYVITNVWKCGDTIIESGVSNQAGVPAGPTITNLKVTGKMKVTGSGFADGVQVFVNGVGFVKAAVSADTTLTIQKGPLTDGTAIPDVGTAGTALITLKNPDGGLASFSFKRP